MSTVLWRFVRGDDDHAEFIVLPSREARAILDAWMEEGTYDMTVSKVAFDFAGVTGAAGATEPTEATEATEATKATGTPASAQKPQMPQ